VAGIGGGEDGEQRGLRGGGGGEADLREAEGGLLAPGALLGEAVDEHRDGLGVVELREEATRGLADAAGGVAAVDLAHEAGGLGVGEVALGDGGELGAAAGEGVGLGLLLPGGVEHVVAGAAADAEHGDDAEPADGAHAAVDAPDGLVVADHHPAVARRLIRDVRNFRQVIVVARIARTHDGFSPSNRGFCARTLDQPRRPTQPRSPGVAAYGP
jgi:hypothetical protein